MVAKKDFNAPKHHNIDVPNLFVIKLMHSLRSRGYVKEDFNWQWYYWFLTNEGIEYLRNFLHLPEEIVPATLKKPRTAPRQEGERGPRGAPGGPRGGRPFAESGEKKVGGPAADFKPDFVRVIFIFNFNILNFDYFYSFNI
jgi:small subunit ribosomal protein S10e